MPKFPKPWFRPSRSLWFVTLNGKQINLGADRTVAFQEYARLISEPRPVQSVRSDSLAAIIDSFMEWVQRNRSQGTYDWFRYRLERFAQKYPDMRARDLRPYHVQQWVDGYDFSVTSRRNYFRTVKRCFSWATKQGYLDFNPIANLEVPAADRKEVMFTQTEFDEMLTFVKNDSLRDLLIVTWETGCRPQESLRLEARHVDLVNQRWVFPKSESKNKKLARVVYMTDTATQIVQCLVERHPKGKVFCNTSNKPWTTYAVNCAMSAMRIRVGQKIIQEQGIVIPDAEIEAYITKLKPTRKSGRKVIPKTPRELQQEARRKLIYQQARQLAPKYSLYALRHSWATRALQSGIDGLTVAVLMGHSDPSTLARVYQHLSHNPQHLLDQMKKASEH